MLSIVYGKKICAAANLQESWSKGSHAGRDLATVFPGTVIFSNNSWLIGQNAPLQQVSRHITGLSPTFSLCTILDSDVGNHVPKTISVLC